MRTSLVALVVAAAAVPGSASEAAASGCGSALPLAPTGLPAPVVLQTACGAYAVDRDGNVSVTSRRRAPWWSPTPYQLDFRRHHVVLIEHGRVRWRSRHAFDPDLAGLETTAVGGRDLAFSFTNGRLWVARLGRPEHPIAASEYALGWTKSGHLLTARSGSGKTTLWVRREDGSRPRLIVRRPLSSAWAWDGASRSLVYVARDRELVRSDGYSRTGLADLGALGLGTRFNLELLPRGLIVLRSQKRMVILRHDGSVFASTAYESAVVLSYGYPEVVGGEQVAFAVDVWNPDGLHARVDVFLLGAGETQATRLLSVDSEFSGGCGWYMRLTWHQSWLLYTDALTNVIALDTHGGGRVDLSATAQHLPGVVPDPSGNGQTGFKFAVWGQAALAPRNPRRLSGVAKASPRRRT